ncbi:MAG: hypothetical protein K2K57_08330 [Oscillospiraceae bacterium]|nr:hypothetical protein [Oscillospiraceae bacterium]
MQGVIFVHGQSDDQGYISKGNEFDCNKTMTRGECMKIIYDYIVQDGEAKPLYEIFKI